MTKIERNMRKQGGRVVQERAAVPLLWHGRHYLCQRYFLAAGMGFSFRVEALRFIFKTLTTLIKI